MISYCHINKTEQKRGIGGKQMKELAKNYDPSKVEERLYNGWKKNISTQLLTKRKNHTVLLCHHQTLQDSSIWDTLWTIPYRIY